LPVAERRPGEPLARTATEIAAAQSLLERQQQKRQNHAYQSNMSLNHRRALNAYSSQQNLDEKDYVARVLGVDDYA